LKKPLFKFTSVGDRVRLALFLALFALAVSLFVMPKDAVAVMSSGGAEAPKSLFGLLSRFA
jgi:hypothetical protein